ncbi:MAG: hypothetical protein H7067_12175, partial [Burkholderiales bacterium]|nr:hypothetical protein [Opitutaceae bacterium]
LVVGPPGWSEPLVALLRHREAALAAFGETLLPNQTRAKDVIAPALAHLVDGIVRIARLEKDSARQFLDFSRDAHLAPAIQELLALFTPARWAYAPLDVRIESDSGRDQRDDRFELQSQGLDVGQVLNTAELNTLSLALYLLCAPRVDNPCRVLFLDDPFQNMDELTVATVTRGLARLLRLWGDETIKLADWDIVLLLHGEETCQRVLLETRAAFYRLPWLAPADSATAPKDDDVTPAPGTEKGELLPLAGFFAELPG